MHLYILWTNVKNFIRPLPMLFVFGVFVFIRIVDRQTDKLKTIGLLHPRCVALISALLNKYHNKQCCKYLL